MTASSQCTRPTVVGRYMGCDYHLKNQCGGEVKPYHFQEFLKINDKTCQVDVLEELVSGQLSLKEFKVESKFINKRWIAQTQFNKDVGLGSWDRCREVYPHHTMVEAMDRFSGLNFSKTLTYGIRILHQPNDLRKGQVCV